MQGIGGRFLVKRPPPRALLFKARGAFGGGGNPVLDLSFVRRRESTSPSWALNLPAAPMERSMDTMINCVFAQSLYRFRAEACSLPKTVVSGIPALMTNRHDASPSSVCLSRPSTAQVQPVS